MKSLLVSINRVFSTEKSSVPLSAMKHATPGMLVGGPQAPELIEYPNPTEGKEKLSLYEAVDRKAAHLSEGRL